MIAIIDYGVGNLFSLASSLNAVGVQDCVTTDRAQDVRAADKLILPGVGAFGDARAKLAQSGLDRVVTEQVQAGKPILGICLGMQLLFEKSMEYGEHAGLGYLKGQIVPIRDAVPDGMKIPHIGWNRLRFHKENPLFQYIREGDFVYFVHSFYARGCEDSLLASAEYGAALTAAVAKDNVYGCQFHPEKSGAVGLNILRGFVDL